MKKLFLFFILFLGLWGTACSKKEVSKSSGIDLKEGKWEITVSMESSSYPGKLPNQVYTQCITKDEAIPIQGQAMSSSNQNCVYKQKEVKGNSISWIMECKEEGETIVNQGSMVYKGDQFDGRVIVKSKDTEFVQTMQGKWVGKCEDRR
ncbi:DUF3617 family protein [Thermodesulfobacterium sp. TA1]|uniref:DUF3617 domain-containing protein n=1 Tax=Thermodesulfobacterium sp. TA1 TaxID=2234087 RepID=UPI00143DCC07|nr:DUF3617 family protein [Thermodesulfobacterium sp. TA1]